MGRRRMLFGCLLLVLFWLDLVTHAPTQNPGVKSSVYAPGWARAQLKLNPDPKLGGSRVMLSPAALTFLRYNPTAQSWRRPICETGWPFASIATCWMSCLKLTASFP